MRIEKILFERVGCWQGRELTFAPGLNFVYGENEAGKSTARRAIEALLFSLESDDLRRLAAPLKPRDFAATLYAVRAVDGGEESLAWRRRGTRMKDLEGKDLPEEVRRACLSAVSLDDFRAIYCLGHEGLREGSRLLGRGGALGRILLDVVSGGQDVNGLRQELASALEDQYSEHGNARRQRVNAALHEASQLDEEARRIEALKSYDAYRRAVEERDRCRDERHRAESDRKAAREAVNALNRIGSVPHVLAAVGARERSIEALRAEGPTPSREWLRAARPLREAIHENARELREARRLASDAAGLLEGRTPSGQVLAREQALRKLTGERAFLASSDDDSKALEHELDAAEERLVGVVRDCGARATREEVRGALESLSLGDSDRSSVTRLLGEMRSRAEELSRLEGSLEDASDRADELAEELAELGEPADVRGLKALQAFGPLAAAERSVEELRSDLAQQEDSLARQAARLGFATPSDVRACASTRVPGEGEAQAVVDRHKTALSAQAQAEQTLSGARGAMRERAERVRRLSAATPTAAQLEELPRLREDRDAAYEQARRLSLDPSIDASVRFGRLDEAFTRHQKLARAVDETVDTLLAQARAVEELVAARHELESSRGRVDEAARDAERARGAVEVVLTEWRELWSATPVASPAIEEAAAWGVEHRRFLEAVEAWTTRSRATENAAREAIGQRERMVAAFAASDDALASELDAMLVHAISAADSLAATKAERDGLLKRAKREVGSKTREVESTQESLGREREAFLEAARRHAHSLFADALEPWAQRIEALAVHAKTVREATRRRDEHLARRKQVLDALSSALDELENSGAPVVALRALRPVDQLAELDRLLEVAFTTREREGNLGKLQDNQRKLEGRAEALRDEWRAVLDAAGLADLEPEASACDELLDRLDRTFGLEDEIRDRREEARTSYAGTWEELVEAVGGRDEVDLERDLEAAKEHAQDLDGLVTRWVQEEKEAQAGLDRLEATSSGRALSMVVQEHESAVTRAVDELVEALTLRGALSILDRARADLHEESQQRALLDSAGRHLARLTRGSLVEIEHDGGGGDQLYVRRAGPEGESLDVKQQLSDGARDQLWLALRLSLIEPHLSVKRVPLVLDDVLVHFDDERALAALEAFAELARHTQVIVFTHHEHLLGLARKAGIAFREVRLDPPAQRGDVPDPEPLSPAMPPPIRVAQLPTPENVGAVADAQDEAALIGALVERGGRSGNGALRSALGWDESRYHSTKDALVTKGRIIPGKGRGGSVRLADEETQRRPEPA